MPILEINGRDVEVDESFLKMSPEQQNATVDEIAAALPQQKPQSLRETISEASPLVGAVLRGVQQIPPALVQVADLVSRPMLPPVIMGPFGPVPVDKEELRPTEDILAEGPAGGLMTAYKPSEREKQIAGQSPVQSIVGEALGSAFVGPAGTAGKLPVAARMGEAAFQGALGSQLAATETPEERIANLYTGAALGPVFRAGTEALGAVTAPLRKYMPFGDKSKLAAVELQEARGGRTAAEERAVYNRVVALFGKEDADKLSLYDITGDPAAKNKAVAYAMAQGPEGTRMIQEAAAAKSAAIENKLRSYTENLRLSKRESDYVKKLQQELLPNVKVSAGDFNEITSDPVIKNFLTKQAGKSSPQYAAVEAAQARVAELRGLLADTVADAQLTRASTKAAAAEARGAAKTELVDATAQYNAARLALKQKRLDASKTGKYTADKREVLALEKQVAEAKDRLSRAAIAGENIPADAASMRRIAELRKAVADASSEVRTAKTAVERALPEDVMLFRSEVEGLHPTSAGYLDAVRKRLQDKRFAADTTRTEAEFYRKAVQKIDNALGLATGGKYDPELKRVVGGRYDAMKSLQQRQLLTRELDNEFSSVLKTLREGESVPDLKEVKKIFKGKNFQELTQEASRLKDGPRRAKAERSLQLIQHFVRDADPDSVVKQLGKGEIASPEGGGAATLVVKPVGRFLRGEYNKEMAYLIDHPEQYVKELEKIAEGPTASRLPEFSRLLGRIQAEEASGE